VSHPFQIWAVDIMDLPRTKRGNQHVIVFHDLFSKWPMVYPVPDQKAVRIARLLAEEIVPVFGVPEGLLSDRGANLLSHVMDEVCSILGVKKLNTTSYHPQGDGCVERFNHTLRVCRRSTLHGLEVSGMYTCMGYSGPTGTPHMLQRERSPHTFRLDWTIDHQQR